MPMPPSRRVLLKLSGEALMGEQQFGIDPDDGRRAWPREVKAAQGQRRSRSAW